MIVRRYGATVQEVVPNFDARAMTEVGFLRQSGFSMPRSEFEQAYERGEAHELSADAAGDVQGDVEEAVLTELREKLAALEAGLRDGEVLLIENEPGVDQPKTRGTQATQVVGVENRLHFTYTIDPPLKVAVWRPRG